MSYYIQFFMYKIINCAKSLTPITVINIFSIGAYLRILNCFCKQRIALINDDLYIMSYSLVILYIILFRLIVQCNMYIICYYKQHTIKYTFYSHDPYEFDYVRKNVYDCLLYIETTNRN